MSARLFLLFFPWKLTSGDKERLRRRALADNGVTRVDPFDDGAERRLRGVYGVEIVVTGVYGDCEWRTLALWLVRCGVAGGFRSDLRMTAGDVGAEAGTTGY